MILDAGENGRVDCLVLLPLTGVNPRTLCFLAIPRRALHTASRFPSIDNGTLRALATLRSSSAGMHDMISSRLKLDSSRPNTVTGVGGFVLSENVSLNIEERGGDDVLLVELPETDRLDPGRSGGVVAMASPSSSTSTRLTLAAHNDSRIASASSGSAFSSAALRPDGMSDHGFAFCFPLAFVEMGASVGFDGVV